MSTAGRAVVHVNLVDLQVKPSSLQLVEDEVLEFR